MRKHQDTLPECNHLHPPSQRSLQPARGAATTAMSRVNDAPEPVRIDASYKEVVHHQAQPEPAAYYPPHGHHGGPNHGIEGTGSHAGMYSMQSSGEGNIERKPPTLQGQPSGATIYGLTQRNFMILCIVALVVLGAAIGGGVGGGLAARCVFSPIGNE